VIRPAVVLFAIIVAGGVGCGEESSAPALPSDGFFLAGEAEALSRLLEGFGELHGTPLGSAAVRLRGALVDCARFSLHFDPVGDRTGATGGGEGRSLWDAASDLSCDSDDASRAAGARSADGAPLVFAIPFGEGGRMTGRIHVDPDGSVRLDAQIDPLPEAGIAAFFLPHQAPPSAGSLAHENTVVYAQLRPEPGLDFARLIDENSQGDALFRLKSQLFSRAVLAGSIETAVYPPPDGHALPAVAAAAAFTSRAIAITSMEAFVAELEETWSLEHTPLQFAIAGETASETAGACFLELRILPEFAPCYVITDRSIVVGWNQASLESALLTRPSDIAKSASAHHGRFELQIDQMAKVDEALQSAFGRNRTENSATYAWQQLVVTAHRDGSPIRVTASLFAKTPDLTLAEAQ
jgi:hypothetical protein